MGIIHFTYGTIHCLFTISVYNHHCVVYNRLFVENIPIDTHFFVWNNLKISNESQMYLIWSLNKRRKLYCQLNELILWPTLFLSSVLFKVIGKRKWRKIFKFYSLCKGSDVKVATQMLSPERRAGLFITSLHDTISPQSRFSKIKIRETKNFQKRARAQNIRTREIDR